MGNEPECGGTAAVTSGVSLACDPLADRRITYFEDVAGGIAKQDVSTLQDLNPGTFERKPDAESLCEAHAYPGRERPSVAIMASLFE